MASLAAKRPRLKIWIEAAGITSVTLVIIPFALEGGFRLFPGAIPVKACATSEFFNLAHCHFFWRYDDPLVLGYTYQPNYYWEGDYNPSDPSVINAANQTCAPLRDDTFRLVLDADSHGFLNQDPWMDNYDLIVTGDSFTQPWTQVQWIEELQDQAGLSVLNLGMDGWGTLNQVEAVRRHGLDKNPKWVILAYFEGNDVFNNEEYRRRQASGMNWREYLLKSQPWQERLILTHLVRYVLDELFPPPDSTETNRCEYPMTVATEVSRFETVFSDTHIYALGFDAPRLEALPEWEWTKSAIREIDVDVKAQGSRFLLVYVPSKEHLYWPRVWEPDEVNTFLTKAIPYTGYDYFNAHVHDQMILMEQFAQDNDIAWLNLYYPLEDVMLAGNDVYNYADVHWNDLGNIVVAQQVIAYLAKHSD